MKVKSLHQDAMEFSFKAKQAALKNNFQLSHELFCKAADLESKVAKFYFDKPEYEPTRSIIIRSAAFLNLKAGLIRKSQEFIFFGLLNIKDEEIISQLNNALELSISFRNLNSLNASEEYSYLNRLRQNSIHYVMEPAQNFFGESVSMSMVKDFSENFLKSFKSYAATMFSRLIKDENYTENAAKEFAKLANPLFTNISYGSFKFSLANDFLSREGEDEKVKELKSNLVQKYHYNIFTNPLNQQDIKDFKEQFTEEEINNIFRPLINIKSRNTPYKIGYYDLENFNKVFLNKIASEQKKKLLPIKELNKDDIGTLENSIIHSRSLKTGKTTKKTILTEELKAFEFEQIIKEIAPKNYSSIILNEEILLNINFDSNKGFILSFPDFNLEVTDTEYQRALDHIMELAYMNIISLSQKEIRNDKEEEEWNFIYQLIGNPEALSG